MIDNFDHVHIYAADVEHTIAFYVDVLGAERIGALPNSAGGSNHLLALGGQFIAVSAFPVGLQAKPPPTHGDGALTHGFGVAHIGLNVRDIDPFVRRLRQAGIDTHASPTRVGALRYVYFTAPDGVVVELTQYELPARMAPVLAAWRLFNR